MSINGSTELNLINTAANSGTITLPLASSTPGRVLNFKDSQGTFGTNTVTLQCSGSDTFEDGATNKVLREVYGSIQIVASGTKWYILNGTQVNTLQTSTLNVQAISSFSVSTINSQISSLSFIDNRNSTNSLYAFISSVSIQAVSTNFLTYNNYIISGTRVGYSNVLNRRFFSPLSIPGLALWFDASDMSTVITSASNVRQWLDKSLNKNHSQVLTTNFPNVSSFGSVNLSSIAFRQGASQPFVIPINDSFENTIEPYILALVCKPNSNDTRRRGVFGKNVSYGWNPSIFFYPPYTLQFANATAGTQNLNSFAGNPVQMITSHKSNSNNTSVICYQNGNLIGNISIIASNPFNRNGSPYYIGSALLSGPTGDYYDGEIGELLFYNKSNTTNFERQQIEGYLAWKWGTQSLLPANHPFKNAPPQ